MKKSGLVYIMKISGGQARIAATHTERFMNEAGAFLEQYRQRSPKLGLYGFDLPGSSTPWVLTVTDLRDSHDFIWNLVRTLCDLGWEPYYHDGDPGLWEHTTKFTVALRYVGNE